MSKESALGAADPQSENGDAINPPSAQVQVVDDDASVRSALGRLLGSCGYEVTAFHNAESFLAEHDPHAWGCIILDVAMPGLDGPAVQRALEQRGNQMPIIFLTGPADVPICAAAMKSGAFDFLTKPVDEAVLVAAVAKRCSTTPSLLSAAAEREADRVAPGHAHRARARSAGPRDERSAEQADRRRPGHRRKDHQGASRARHGEDARALGGRTGSHGGAHPASAPGRGS